MLYSHMIYSNAKNVALQSQFDSKCAILDFLVLSFLSLFGFNFPRVENLEWSFLITNVMKFPMQWNVTPIWTTLANVSSEMRRSQITLSMMFAGIALHCVVSVVGDTTD